MWQLAITAFELGILYTLIVVSAWLTSVLLNYDDLALEASFGLGGALQARLLAYGLSPFCSPFITLIAGLASGLLTSVLHIYLGLNNLLTGIIMVTAFFSINMFIGTVNMTVIQYGTLFDYFPTVAFIGNKLPALLVIACITVASIYWLLTTQCGFVMRATGNNPVLVAGIGKSPALYFTLTMMIAHSITAFAGALFVQYTGFYSLWSSTGILAAALAGLAIARSLSSRFGVELIIGACLYQAIIAIALNFELPAEYSRIVPATMLVLLMSLQRKSNAHNQ
jgi:putative tryptophan/tyrosine transport system permease protein